MKKLTKEQQLKNSIPSIKKEGRPIKEVVPPLNKEPREVFVSKLNESLSRDYKCFAEPSEIHPEWPGNEEAKVNI